jgi:hypothetical protein
MAFDNVVARSSWFQDAASPVGCNRSYPPSHLETINPAGTLLREKE